MRLPLPLLLAVACVAVRPLTTTPPSSWTGAGWDQLRWGMGSADVQKTLAPEDWFGEVESAGSRSVYALHPGERLFGQRVAVTLSFIEGALRQISVERRARRTKISERACGELLVRIRQGLEAKYGKPTCEWGDEKLPHCAWAHQDAAVVLSYEVDDDCPVTILYTDPVFEATRRRQL